VFVDVAMPGALLLAHELRGTRALASAGLVGLTSERGLVQAERAAGFTRHLAKPIDNKSVEALVLDVEAENR
jgi:CheY-like chemotaxis protein